MLRPPIRFDHLAFLHDLHLIAGPGFEPGAFWVRARRSAKLNYPASLVPAGAANKNGPRRFAWDRSLSLLLCLKLSALAPPACAHDRSRYGVFLIRPAKTATETAGDAGAAVQARARMRRRDLAGFILPVQLPIAGLVSKYLSHGVAYTHLPVASNGQPR